MNTSEILTRPWWNRKRWRLALAFWLVFPALYPLSAGPIRYAIARGWMPDGTFHTIYRPVREVAVRSRFLDGWGAYHSWWHLLGQRHRTKVCTIGGPGWEIVISSDLECSRRLLRTTDHSGTFVSGWGGHEIVVEHGHRTPNGELVAWNGPVLLDGRPVATLPTGTRRLSIDFFDGELSVEADGEAVEVED